MFDCVIFDLDETLISFGRHVNWERACRRIVDLYLWRGVPKEIFGRYICNPLSLMSNTQEEIFKVFPREKALKILDEASRILDLEEFEALPRATVVPGCEEVLRWLRGRGVHVGIVSSNSWQVVSYLLKKLKLRGFVESVVGRAPNIKLKPHPEQVLLCLEKMGCQRERTALVAVDEDGVRAGKASGVHVIIILSSSKHSIARLLDAETDSIVENLKALPSLFQQL